MSGIIQSCEYRGYTIEVTPTADPREPFEDMGRLGTFAFFDRSGAYKNEGLFAQTDFGDWDQMQAYIEGKRGLRAICLPVYIYRHGADAISTTPFTCTWDSGQLGFTFATKEAIRDWFGWKYVTGERVEKARKVLQSEIELMNKYIRGEVYDWTIHNSLGGFEDSCGEYYSEEEAVSSAKHFVNGLVKADELVAADAWPV